MRNDLRLDLERRRREGRQDFDLEEEEPEMIRRRPRVQTQAQETEEERSQFFIKLLETIFVNKPQSKIKKYNEVPKYNGNTDYSIFQAQFNTLAAANEWDDKDKCCVASADTPAR